MDYLGLKLGRTLGKLVSKIAFGPAEKVGEVEIEPGVRAEIYRVPKIVPRWAWAQTWGNHIYTTLEKEVLKEDVGVWLIAHEATHVLQWKRYGPLFPILYLLDSLWRAVTLGNYYYDNRFEVEARRETLKMADLVKEKMIILD
jgi:hypothetical protein